MGITVDGKRYRIQFKGNYKKNERRQVVFWVFFWFFLLQSVIMFSSSLKKIVTLVAFLPKRDIGLGAVQS